MNIQNLNLLNKYFRQPSGLEGLSQDDLIRPAPSPLPPTEKASSRIVSAEMAKTWDTARNRKHIQFKLHTVVNNITTMRRGKSWFRRMRTKEISPPYLLQSCGFRGGFSKINIFWKVSPATKTKHSHEVRIVFAEILMHVLPHVVIHSLVLCILLEYP